MISWVLGVGFVLLVLVGFAVELIARRAVPKRPTGGDLVRILVATRTGRFVVVALWVWVGWHFLAR
ncbi:DUF6186 family protein [Actinophytocola gossypii]|uniref:Uncharacterized protein n=1 Tax=Actinophytocola gossypii TaxID=2812003 RepID=A0ABT2JC89_9PSEU|nr:DUF6186 family protein [Actinophytocola gossypii]MCT2585363.1 hypothetical protein [Actinophytocola gossypii]